MNSTNDDDFDARQDPDMVLPCCVSLERFSGGRWFNMGNMRDYEGPAAAVVLKIMQEAKEQYPVAGWLNPALNQAQPPDMREVPPDPMLAALGQEEDKIRSVFVRFDIYIKDGRGMGVGVDLKNSILVRDFPPPPPSLREFSSEAVQPPSRWPLPSLRAVMTKTLGVTAMAGCAAAGVALYHGDAMAAVWIVVAVAVELLRIELSLMALE